MAFAPLLPIAVHQPTTLRRVTLLLKWRQWCPCLTKQGLNSYVTSLYSKYIWPVLRILIDAQPSPQFIIGNPSLPASTSFLPAWSTSFRVLTCKLTSPMKGCTQCMVLAAGLFPRGSLCLPDLSRSQHWGWPVFTPQFVDPLLSRYAFWLF